MELQRFGPEPSVAISSAAVQARDQAIAQALEIKAVGSPEAQALAAEALKGLKEIGKSAEADRKALKSPVIKLGQLIDATIERHLGPVVAESNRISALIAEFQTAESRKLEEARFEQLRIEREAEIERLRITEAAAQEQVRIQLEADLARRHVQEATNATARAFAEELEQEALEKRREAQVRKAQGIAWANQEAERVRMEGERKLEAAAPARTSGLVVTDSWQFEILDLDLLRDQRPELVKVEPNRSAILAAIRGGMRRCPGLHIWSEKKATVRT